MDTSARLLAGSAGLALAVSGLLTPMPADAATPAAPTTT
jgi:hypothetical protein